MKDSGYINIQGWMINGLDLKPNELIVYALIYGFSQDEQSSFQGSIKYIENTINTSRPTAVKVLKTLVEKGLIVKIPKEINGVKFNDYKHNPEAVKKVMRVVKNFNQGSKETLPGDSKETLPHNTIIDNNIDNNISALPISDTSSSVYVRCMELYNDFVIEVTGVKPNITAITGKSLKGIIKYLDGMTGKNPEKTTQALEYIFANYHLWDTFHQKNLKMEAILSNIVNIIKSIKDGREKPQQQQQSVDDWTSTIENLTNELRENGGYEESSINGLVRKRVPTQR